MAVATWYFTRDKATSIGTGTVVAAILTSLFYHSGTAAFGSLVIAIIKTIRAVVSYFQKKTKDSGNKVVQVILHHFNRHSPAQPSPAHRLSYRRDEMLAVCIYVNQAPSAAAPISAQIRRISHLISRPALCYVPL